MRTEPIIVGFAGRIGSGKTSAATYLQSKYGFQYARYSLVLQEWISEGSSDRVRLQEAGWGIMSGGLQVELNSRLIAGLDRSKCAAIDGLRHSIDFDSLSSAFGASFTMIFLEARSEVRMSRSAVRFRSIDAFQTADAHPVESAIDHLKSKAICTMCNDGSLEELHGRLDEWFNSPRIGAEL